MSNLRTYLKEHFNQFLYTLHSIPEAIRFFRKNRLWEGFLRYGWVNKILILVGIIAGLQMLGNVFESMNVMDTSNAMALMSSMDNFVDNLVKNQWEFFTDEGFRYGILILLEIFIFHVTHRAVDILLKDKMREPRLNDFIKAQIRIAVLGVICMVVEGIVVAIVEPIVKATPVVSWLKEPILFFIHCFFMGVLILDNYNEMFGLKIKESFKYSLRFPGIALAAGMVLRICFIVPFIGPVVGTLVTAVTVSIVMHELANLQLEDGDWEEELV
jgi:hypothetical protein